MCILADVPVLCRAIQRRQRGGAGFAGTNYPRIAGVAAPSSRRKVRHILNMQFRHETEAFECPYRARDPGLSVTLAAIRLLQEGAFPMRVDAGRKTPYISQSYLSPI
jgi:hypothetical protein